jgi:hypothetical protein
MIGSLKNSLISERKPYVSSKPISNMKNSWTTQLKLRNTQNGPQEGTDLHCGGFRLSRTRAPHDNNYIVRRYLLCFYFYNN